jgi:RNA polymerase sigma-70 factor, ECF subfamily
MKRDDKNTSESKESGETPEVLEAYRPLLFAIAYQMTGSASGAEDLVQETYLRYQQARAKVEIQSVKAFLTTITTHLAIDYL